MTQLGFDVRYFATTTKGQKNELLLEYVASLKATIEAQEIIIKDKSKYMEAMAKPKTCDGCVFEATKQNHSNWCSGCIREKMYLYDDRYEPKAQP